MEKKGTGVVENGLIWFGAAVSLAEILTGTYFATLGFTKGFLAIVLGHIIGAFLLFATGVIGGKKRQSAMETVKGSFGQKGGLLFALLNILQLVGWTAIMIYDGSLAAQQIFPAPWAVFPVLIGALIILWLAIGIKNLGKLNVLAMGLLFAITIVLSVVILQSEHVVSGDLGALSFGAALELSIAMPLSWLPLISDYTREAEKPVLASGASALVYTLISIWMYTIGMGAVLLTGESDIGLILVKAGLGAVGLVIVVLSTVTTTFLDAYSAGISAESVKKGVNGKHLAILTALIGTILAVFYPMDDITEFLYLIGSVFAPMAAVLIGDAFFLKREDTLSPFHWKNLVIWLVGFLLYRYLMTMDFVLGSTIPTIVLTLILTILVNKTPRN